jgi:hypothetical protein
MDKVIHPQPPARLTAGNLECNMTTRAPWGAPVQRKQMYETCYTFDIPLSSLSLV